LGCGINLKNDKLRKKAEQLLQNQFNHIDNPSTDDEEYVHELSVHQIELKIQNEELKVAQTNLEDSRRKYFDLYNFAPIGYFTLNKDGIIVDANLAGAELLGVERLNLYNTAFIQYITQDNLSQFHQYMMKVQDTDIKQSTEIKLLNDTKPFYAHLETITVHENGNIKEFRLTITEITELKNSEKKKQDLLIQLKQSNKELQEANTALNKKKNEMQHINQKLRENEVRMNRSQEIAHLGSWELDLKNNYLSWSDEVYRIYGLKPEEFDGTYEAFISAVHPDDRDMVNEAYTGSLRDGRDIFEIEHKIIRKSTGEIRIVYEKCEHIRDGYGKIFRSEGMVHDITKRKMDEEKLKDTMDELERSNKELERFAYVSSHDLQEPLRMVTLFSQLLEKRYKDKLDNDADEFIEYIVEGSQRMKQLIDDLLEYSRVTSRAKEFENVKLEGVLDIVLTNLSISIVEYGVTISHDPLPTVLGNQNQLLQVFQNLLLNAIKFHGQNPPEIHISAQKDEKEWIFSVSDNGIGIDPEHQKQIFEVFKRLNHNREDYPGSGIGLSITQKIIIHHGGRIWVESELGKGSTFYFTLPIIG
jgi:two-component system, chemotaxis family, sensor kinase Cph1